MLDKDTKSIIAEGNPHELIKSSDERVSDFFNRKPKEAPPPPSLKAPSVRGKPRGERQPSP